jgi:hypothetical protein
MSSAIPPTARPRRSISRCSPTRNTATQRDAGTVTEVSRQRLCAGGGHEQYDQLAERERARWPRKSNGTTFTFPTPTGSWGTVTAYGIYDASSAGNLLAWADLDTPNTVATGNTVQFGSQGMVFTLD